MREKAVVIGGGIGGIGIACMLGKKGYEVTVIEKNDRLGGRCSIFEEKGFVYDMGPSWYLMPGVYEHFFTLMGERIQEHLDLIKLKPSYRVFFKDCGKQIDSFSDLSKDLITVEALEEGASRKFRRYIERSRRQYDIAMDHFIYKNYDSLFDLLNLEMLTKGMQLSVFSTMNDYVSRYFKSAELQKLLQYQLVFLGSSPYNTPALYSIMSHIDFNMGVYYPRGGIYKIIEALVRIAQRHGVTFKTGCAVKAIEADTSVAKAVTLSNGERYDADIIVSNADIHHTETELLSSRHRSYSARYWEKRVLAPSGLIIYLGLRGRVASLVHHNLLFAKDWRQNFADIFDRPRWPQDASFYVSMPSATDPSVAPSGKENLFVFVPIASGLAYTPAELEQYADRVLATMEKEMGIADIKKRIEVKRLFCVKDFAERYNSFKGTALGLSHTLSQTALFRPANRSKRLRNLFYVGGNTNPGIGMPICLISAELAYKKITGNRSPGPLREL